MNRKEMLANKAKDFQLYISNNFGAEITYKLLIYSVIEGNNELKQNK